jgi:hypothetical protein
MDATLIATLSGTLLGGLMTYASTARQARASIAALKVQFDAQLELASRQFEAEQTSESRRNRQQRLDTAYQELCLWLDQLDATVEKVWELTCNDTIESTAELRELCGNWPFTVLKPPKSASYARCFWSGTVESLIREFSASSVAFINSARRGRYGESSEASTVSHIAEAQKLVRDDAQTECWANRGKLLSVTNQIRDEIQCEVLEGRIAGM